MAPVQGGSLAGSLFEGGEKGVVVDIARFFIDLLYREVGFLQQAAGFFKAQFIDSIGKGKVGELPVDFSQMVGGQSRMFRKALHAEGRIQVVLIEIFFNHPVIDESLLA